MRVVLFCQSIQSCWGNPSAPFMRGVADELRCRGLTVDVYEPRDSYSAFKLVQAKGPTALGDYRSAYPRLNSRSYTLQTLSLDEALDGADIVLVHEWNDPELIHMLGQHKADGAEYALLYHDTHHRAVTSAEDVENLDLDYYDGVLTSCQAVRRAYLTNGLAKQAWVWREAADPQVFRPCPSVAKRYDLLWVGSWEHPDQTPEMEEFLIKPVKDLGLKARAYGVDFAPEAQRLLEDAGIEYGGWIPNYMVPREYARARATIHVPRTSVAKQVPGLVSIKMFEALACGVPLVSAPWLDADNVFCDGDDYLMASNGEEMKRQLQRTLDRPQEAAERAASGRETVLRRHTTIHRADELLGIAHEAKRAERTGVMFV